MRHVKPAPAAHPVHDLVRNRWSTVSFSGEPLEAPTLRSLLEAARWAPSSRNEQPWRFVVAPRGDEKAFDTLLACLDEGNRRWAGAAGALLLAVARTTFAQTGAPNPHAWHDVGLAIAQLTLQATALGLSVHPMGGFSAEAARTACGIPDGFEPVTALAVGAPAPPDALPEDLRRRELEPRRRRPQSEFAFGLRWGEAWAGEAE
ncbi:MAG: nitroreductase [Deltaproteobacteria bacterium]|nr:MAG: nitroreductase [Deltaproteobacteria bacterium]